MKIKTNQKEHPLPDGRLTLLGSIDGVTPTMTLVEMGGHSILVDCGVRDFDDPLPPEALSVNTVLLTHAHNDHVSGLFHLLAHGVVTRVIATAPTLEIAKQQIKDGLHIQKRRESEYRSFVRRFDAMAFAVNYGDEIELDKDITARFVEAGHILGSASIELNSKESRLIISGDLGRPNSPILRDYNTEWRNERPVDLVLMESTYGDRIQDAPSSELENQLEQAIKHALEDGGHILVPSFAIGRTQVLLYLLNDLVESGRLPDLKVAVDTPMGLAITDTYKRFEKLYDREYLQRLEQGDDPIDFETLFAVNSNRDSHRLDDVEESVLIIAGSGMCTGGRIVNHLIELLPRPETDVIFVGHQAYGTPGHLLQQLGNKVERAEEPATIVLHKQLVEVNANITTLHGISAHADQVELAKWVGAIPNVRTVALHHGDEEAQAALAEVLLGGLEE